METGTISKWNVKEGDSFIAGDSLAEIETDKASMDFEAQDDGVVAKILVEAGSGDVVVGKPIIVTVEEEDEVAAFANFVVEEEAAPAPPAAAVEEPAAAVEEPAAPEPTPVVAAAPVPVVEAVPVPLPEPIVAAAPVVEDVVVSSAPTVGPSWGNFARVKSPLASILSADQKKYVDTYGSTGQVPL
jgi:pyruvate dehydrogenase E2 component (dihydrolipoamide acetyltransferase)